MTGSLGFGPDAEPVPPFMQLNLAWLKDFFVFCLFLMGLRTGEWSRSESVSESAALSWVAGLSSSESSIK